VKGGVEVEETQIVAFQVFLLDWYKENKRIFPWRYTFNPYKILISEVLLQQTNADNVVDPYNNIIEKYASLNELSNSDPVKLRELFKKIGLFYRADRLIEISEVIINQYSGIIPDKRDELMDIKGIGNYICNAILCFGYNKPYAVLDTNVIRIFKRVFGVESMKDRPRDDKKLWEFAQVILPEDCYVDYNYALLDFAAKQCTSYSPKCVKCIMRTVCYDTNKN
jgi:A/G-specific adenine glycosylase